VPLPTIVDSHCHLDVQAFAEDLDAVLARARDAGIRRMLTICQRFGDLPRVVEISERYDEVFHAVGIHPHLVGTEAPATVEDLDGFARHPKAVGIGETGLDYFYDNAPRDAQAASFRVHIAAARATGLPVIVHTRDADDDTAAILEDEYARGPFSGVLHCFSSGRALAERAVAIGMYVSIAGIVTFRNADDLRETVKALPAERLLVETDAPFLAPIPKRGRRNEPAYVRHTHAAVAALRGMDDADCARLTTANFHRLFAKVPPPAEATP
jgi:TatD DNase family protein